MLIAVTGAAGHLGANVVRDLIDHGFKVRALDLPSEVPASLIGLDVEYFAGSVLDPNRLRQVFDQVDSVVNLAAIISINGDPSGIVKKTNTEGPRNVAQACLDAGVSRLVHVSSVHAFKSSQRVEKLDEASPKADQSSFVYDQTKVAGEVEVLKAIDRGLNAVILNPTGILGPCDFQTSYSGQMLCRLLGGTMPAVLDAGFDWVDARDVAWVIRSALGKGTSGGQFLVPGRWVSFEELAMICADVTGKPVPSFKVPIWMTYPGLPFAALYAKLTGREQLFTYEALAILRDSNKNCRADRVSAAFGYRPRPLKETIADSYDWYLANNRL